MDIETLKQIIRDNLTEEEAGKTLTLAADGLQSKDITDLFATYLEGELSIVNITAITEATDSVTIAGDSNNSIFTEMGVIARFSLVNGDAICSITATPSADWTFASSFSSLDESFLPLLEFADLSLNLSSQLDTVVNPTGLAFIGNLQLTDLLSAIVGLLSVSDSIELTGAIELRDGVPIMSLSKQLKGIELGFFELPYVLFTVSTGIVPQNGDEPAEATAGMIISSELRFQGVPIPITTTLFPYSQTAQFAANFTQALNAALGALSDLANGVDFSSFMPSGFPLDDQLALHDLVLSVKLPEKAPPEPATGAKTLLPGTSSVRKPVLQSILIGVESPPDREWVLVEGAIAIEKLRLQLRVDDVMTQKKVAVGVVGEIGLG